MAMSHSYLVSLVLLISLVLVAAIHLSSVAGAQEKVLMPLIGETKAEFEARKLGLARPTTQSDGSALTFAADPSGHFVIEPSVNGTHIRMLVDTGATNVVLTQGDARRLGIAPHYTDFTYKTMTANGAVLVAPVLLREISIADISVHNVQAVVHSDIRFPVSLLGMSFLSRLKHFEVSGDKLTLKR
jgi:aspartyl protease family protein